MIFQTCMFATCPEFTRISHAYLMMKTSAQQPRLEPQQRIQRRRHHRQQQQHRPRRQRQQRLLLQRQHQQWLPARTITISAKANQMGTTGTANARSTTRATSLAEPLSAFVQMELFGTFLGISVTGQRM